MDPKRSPTARFNADSYENARNRLRELSAKVARPPSASASPVTNAVQGSGSTSIAAGISSHPTSERRPSFGTPSKLSPVISTSANTILRSSPSSNRAASVRYEGKTAASSGFADADAESGVDDFDDSDLEEPFVEHMDGKQQQQQQPEELQQQQQQQRLEGATASLTCLSCAQLDAVSLAPRADSEFLAKTSSLQHRILSLFETAGLKYTADVAIKVAVSDIEVAYSTMRRKVLKRLGAVVQERDILSAQLLALQQSASQQLNDLRVAEADRLRRLRAQTKKQIDKAVAEYKASVGEVQQWNEAQLKEIEASVETKIRAERAAGAAWDQKLRERVQALEEDAAALASAKAQEIASLERSQAALRLEVSRLATSTEEAKAEAAELKLKLIQRDAQLAEAQAHASRLQARLGDAERLSSQERDALMKRVLIQAEESANKALELRTALRDAEHRHHNELQENTAAHQRDLEALNTRIRALVGKKDDQIKSLIARAEAAERALEEQRAYLETELNMSIGKSMQLPPGASLAMLAGLTPRGGPSANPSGVEHSSESSSNNRSGSSNSSSAGGGLSGEGPS